MVSSKIHDGLGVVPGRYAGEAIPIHDGPTPEQLAFRQHKRDADGLAGRICAAAAETARSTSLLLELVGEFDAIGGMRHWIGFKSLGHWLSWSCAMTPGVAREHVRVARALRRMQTIAGLFREGRLSYSKVREVTRVVGVVDEARLAGLAVTATAAQLAKMISGFRGADGMRVPQQHKCSVAWQEWEDGMIDVRARLPKEEAAVLIAAVDAARDQFGPPPPKPDPAVAVDCGEPAPGAGMYSKADALVDVARVFVNTAPQGRSGEDRTLVVVHVSADNLGRVPAGTQDSAVLRAEPVEAQSTGGACIGGVPAGTPEPAEAVCHIENVGSIETATAQKVACDNPVLGAVVDKHGKMLALGRTRRLVSTAQRRALVIRDRGMCQYPGCHQTRHLKAHHLIPWILGGRTDLENLILLRLSHECVRRGSGCDRARGPACRFRLGAPAGA